MESPTNSILEPIEDHNLRDALNELGRCINLTTTYGFNHPASRRAVRATEQAMKHLFIRYKKVTIGASDGVMIVDNTAVKATGALLKAIERRLSELEITGLRISRGISTNELIQLIKLLASKSVLDFKKAITQPNLTHIALVETPSSTVSDEEVPKKQPATSLSETIENKPSATGVDIHKDEIIAFLKGDIELLGSNLGEELIKRVSHPDQLAQLIIKSVSFVQKDPEFSGEPIDNMVLNFLKRTYKCLHRLPAFQSSEGKEELKVALLTLEKSLCSKTHKFTKDSSTEADCKIVQTILEMNETLDFEIAAQKYVANKAALEENKLSMQAYTQSNGRDEADRLVMKTDLSLNEWHSIIVDNQKPKSQQHSDIDNLSTVFKKLESLMKSDSTRDGQVKDMLGKANEDLDDTLCTTQGKLEILSRQVKEDQGSIGGEGRNMTSEELLSALSEVAQELMQPLTAINASMEMMLHGYVGDISPDQKELLSMASSSGEHLKFLMVELINIVGCPTNTGIDERYHTTSDAVAEMKDADGQAKLFQ